MVTLQTHPAKLVTVLAGFAWILTVAQFVFNAPHTLGMHGISVVIPPRVHLISATVRRST